MSNTNRPSVVARDQKFIAGITKRLSNVQSLAIAGKQFTPAEIIQLLQLQIDLNGKIDPAKAAYTDAMAAYKNQSKLVTPVLAGFRAQIRNLFGNVAEVLADFGMAPNKPRTKPTLDARQEAVAKNKATRTARGTKGSKAKKAIKGTVPAKAPTPKA
jgi:hypothetical protein